MDTPLASQIVTALATEHTALVKFVALLEREQALLVENQTDNLLALSRQKTEDAFNIDRLSIFRNTLLHKGIPSLPIQPEIDDFNSGQTSTEKIASGAINVWLKKQCPDGLIFWQKILALAERARQLNITNGKLIQMKMRHNQHTLTALCNAVDKSNLYGPDGQPNFSPGGGRKLGSV